MAKITPSIHRTLPVPPRPRRVLEHAACVRIRPAFAHQPLEADATPGLRIAVARPALAAAAGAVSARHVANLLVRLAAAQQPLPAAAMTAVAMIVAGLPVGVAPLGVQTAGMGEGNRHQRGKHRQRNKEPERDEP